jgi:hypothetical protein
MVRRKEDETPRKAGPDITDRSGSVDEADDHTGVTPFAAAAFLADPLLSLSITALWVQTRERNFCRGHLAGRPVILSP